MIKAGEDIAFFENALDLRQHVQEDAKLEAALAPFVALEENSGIVKALENNDFEAIKAWIHIFICIHTEREGERERERKRYIYIHSYVRDLVLVMCGIWYVLCVGFSMCYVLDVVCV